LLAVSVNSLDGMLRAGLEAILHDGETVSSRRGESREVRSVSLELTNARARISRSSQRGHLFAALGEFIWYLSGEADLAPIEHYIPQYADFIGNGSGAYGPRLFGAGDASRIRNIIELLGRPGKEGTRQAVIQIFDNDDLDGDSRDVPCTCTLQFFVRNDAVELIAYMRSNDVIRGLPFDVFTFTLIQEVVARALGKEVGPYTHMVGSLHLYKDDNGSAHKYLGEGVMAGMAMPAMPDGDPWPALELLQEVERSYRLLEPLPDVLATDPYWLELFATLDGYRAFKDGDSETMQEVRDRLRGSVYELYLTDQHWRLERDNRAK
jgi:thymidylate synthase